MAPRTLTFLAALICWLASSLNLWAGDPTNKNVLLATTTSTRDSGLLDLLIPVFEKKTGYIIKTIAVGTGKALAMGKRGDADVLLTHAPTAEVPLVMEGWLINRVQFMHNDFVIVGPQKDPASVVLAKSAATALKRIFESRSKFVSRGDSSGTHKKEKFLWKKVRVEPKGSWYMESGQGMAATLRIASEKSSYTLADRATYLTLRKTLASRILFEGDLLLLNKYSIMLVNPKRHPHIIGAGARSFHAWLLSGETRRLIADYGRDRFGQPLFYLEPPQ